jgi:hypothetical protein
MTNLMDLRLLSTAVQEGNKKNFHSEAFAFDFQAVLMHADVPFKGQFLAFRRAGIDGLEGIKLEEALNSNTKSFVSKDLKIYVPKGMRVNAKIILHEEGHHLDNKVIGNQLHFWTEVTLEDGPIYCFDNNHPEGIPKHDFFASLEFSLETYLPESEPRPESYALLSQGEISAHTVFRDKDHCYKTHEEILSHPHLLLVTASVTDYRHQIKNEVNWPYRPGKTLTKFPYTFLDDTNLNFIINPPDEKTLYTAQCIQKFQSMKNQLQRMKSPTSKRTNKVVDPQFFQDEPSDAQT